MSGHSDKAKNAKPIDLSPKFTTFNLYKICKEGVSVAITRNTSNHYKLVYHFNKIPMSSRNIMGAFFANKIVPYLQTLDEHFNGGLKLEQGDNDYYPFQWDVIIFPFTQNRAKEVCDTITIMIKKQFGD